MQISDDDYRASGLNKSILATVPMYMDELLIIPSILR